MKCPICNEEVRDTEQAQQWGPEFAHSTCVTAYNYGKADAIAASNPKMHTPSGFTFDTVIAAANPEDLVSLTPDRRAALAAQPRPQPLTDEQIDAIFNAHHNPQDEPWTNWRRFARAIASTGITVQEPK